VLRPPAPAAKAPAAAGGDMVLTPTPEQVVLTPVPSTSSFRKASKPRR